MPEFVVHYRMTVEGDVTINAKTKGSARRAIVEALNQIRCHDMEPFKSSREASCHKAVSIPLSAIKEV
jgi:hypothetical protein